jgi:hypothetical protein
MPQAQMGPMTVVPGGLDQDPAQIFDTPVARPIPRRPPRQPPGQPRRDALTARGTPPALPPNDLRVHGVERPSRGAAGAERSELALDGRERRGTMFFAECLRAKSAGNDLVWRRRHTWKRALSFHDD